MSNNSNHISQWHIFISGNHQNRQQSTGLQKCWKDAFCIYDIDQTPKPKTVFFPVLPWNHDWYTLARFIQINSNFAENHNEPPLINIYAYSWGAGWGAMQLASSLQKVANYKIKNMVLADPVYRSRFFFMRWRTAFVSRYKFTYFLAPKITIPRNVCFVSWSRQYNNWPRAHSLRKKIGTKTIIYPPHLETKLIHSEMDDSHWFQSKVKELTNA